MAVTRLNASSLPAAYWWAITQAVGIDHAHAANGAGRAVLVRVADAWTLVKSSTGAPMLLVIRRKLTGIIINQLHVVHNIARIGRGVSHWLSSAAGREPRNCC